MKKTYLKPESDMIFIYKIWFMYNDMMGMGEKRPKNICTRKKTRNKFPFGFPPIPRQ